jgi:hypothetical protein
VAEVAAHGSLSLAGRASYLRRAWLGLCTQIRDTSRRQAALGQIEDPYQRRAEQVELELAEFDNRQSFQVLRGVIDRHNAEAKPVSEDLTV